MKTMTIKPDPFSDRKLELAALDRAWKRRGAGGQMRSCMDAGAWARHSSCIVTSRLAWTETNPKSHTATF